MSLAVKKKFKLENIPSKADKKDKTATRSPRYSHFLNFKKEYKKIN